MSLIFCSCTGIDVSDCYDVTDVDHYFCDEFDFVPFGDNDLIVRVTTIKPNPQADENQEFTITNFTQSGIEISKLYIQEDESIGSNEYLIHNYSDTIDENSIIQPCDSISISLNISKLFLQENGYYHLKYENGDRFIFLQPFYYESVKEGENVYPQ